MIYSLLVLSSPFSGHCSRSAAEFAHCVIARGHTIHRIFFLDAGTLASAASSVSAQDEDTSLKGWSELADQHGVDLAICITSALKHGMLDQVEADRHERRCATINPLFTVSGLGQLVDACASSDRLITFGG
ncbi:MAG: sulfurtransferase complex subunit TusD [Halioglobus sp.]|uniref:sulfurtransferase complex subunit TusD n=1 Tax=Halioglobus sp. Uisw_031 TaxID=3230977 RepID=UPI003590F2E3